MGFKETSGHLLEIGDKVKMNISVIAEGDLDGVEFSSTEKNYWRYMNEHPDEVYTVTGIDPTLDVCMYVLSGYMGDNTWAADELIHVPEPSSRFEIIKNMTLDEMAINLLPLLAEICEDGVPSEELMRIWLNNI